MEQCLYVKNFWETLFEWLNQNLGYTLTVDVKLIIMPKKAKVDYFHTFVRNVHDA